MSESKALRMLETLHPVLREKAHQAEGAAIETERITSLLSLVMRGAPSDVLPVEREAIRRVEVLMKMSAKDYTKHAHDIRELITWVEEQIAKQKETT